MYFLVQEKHLHIHAYMYMYMQWALSNMDTLGAQKVFSF